MDRSLRKRTGNKLSKSSSHVLGWGRISRGYQEASPEEKKELQILMGLLTLKGV